jgi:ribonuclease BN (tRNA processing enzyme)
VALLRHDGEMIQIKFLGTSNANPHPDRRQSGLIINVDGDFYLFDCGDGVPSAIWNDKKIVMNKIHSVFFSHRHADHLGGLTSFILLMHQRIKKSVEIQPGTGIDRTFPQKKDGKDLSGLTVFIPGDEEQRQLFVDLMDFMHMSDFESKYRKNFHSIMGKQELYQDKNIHVTSFPTYHIIDSVGFIIQIGSYKILYSGDISGPEIVQKEIGQQEFDVIIIENAHFKSERITKALKNLKIKNLIVTHSSDDKILNPESVLNDLKPLMDSINVILAKDGMIFKIGN